MSLLRSEKEPYGLPASSISMVVYRQSAGKRKELFVLVLAAPLPLTGRQWMAQSSEFGRQCRDILGGGRTRATVDNCLPKVACEVADADRSAQSLMASIPSPRE